MYNPQAPQYTTFQVKEEAELLAFILKSLDGISRSKAKSILSGSGVRVNRKIITQFDFHLLPGMVVEVSKRKNATPLTNRFVKLVYEDRHICVIEKNIGILSMATDHHQFCVETVLDD